MKRAVVTGATGTIGTALIDELIRNDIEVVVMRNWSIIKTSKRFW